MTKIPPGSIEKIKKSIYKKNKENKKYIHNKSSILLLQNTNNLQTQIKTLINISKQNYFSRMAKKLDNTSINTKFFWPLLKIFPITKKFYVSHHCTMMINLHAILKRKVKYLMLILRSSG